MRRGEALVVLLFVLSPNAKIEVEEEDVNRERLDNWWEGGTEGWRDMSRARTARGQATLSPTHTTHLLLIIMVVVVNHHHHHHHRHHNNNSLSISFGRTNTQHVTGLGHLPAYQHCQAVRPPQAPPFRRFLYIPHLFAHHR